MARAIGSQILIEIGENIRRRREEIGMSQMSLGFAIGTDAHAVSRCENATRKLKAERICDIADALQTTPANLYPKRYRAENADEKVIERINGLPPEIRAGVMSTISFVLAGAEAQAARIAMRN